MVGRSSKDIERALLRKGFRARDSHHRQFILYRGNSPLPVFTYLSHGKKEYGDSLLASIARQLHLDKAELLKFIDCRMSGEDYLEVLQGKGVI
ncbi:type II toxin-antitoxin system HicA family toxin [bacterium]|nr:type II toxin-antitoxin system HicA family toxin [bacterium]